MKLFYLYKENIHVFFAILSILSRFWTKENILPIVFINVGGKTILGNEIAWGIYTRTFIWPLYYYASNYDENSW